MDKIAVMALWMVVCGLFILFPKCNGRDYNSSYISNEHKLYKFLMDDYEKYVRPVQHREDTVNVQLGITLVAIDDLDEKSQTLSLHVWIKYSWMDVQLTWNKADYDNIDNINLPIGKLWTPDITLYNSANSEPWLDSEHLAIVYASGMVLYIPPVQMKSFGGVRSDKVYPCCPDESYPDITYTIALSRQGSYYSHMYIAPSIALMFLMPALFIMPAESSEKTMLGVGILLSQVFLLTTMESIIPSAHPAIPVVAMYFLANMILASMSLFFSAFIVNAWHKSNRNAMVPSILRTVVLGVLGRICCVRRENFMPAEQSTDVAASRRLEVMSDSEANPGYVDDDKQRMMQTYARLTTISEWRQLAVILDRLLFVIFVIVAFLCTFIMYRR